MNIFFLERKRLLLLVVLAFLYRKKVFVLVLFIFIFIYYYIRWTIRFYTPKMFHTSSLSPVRISMPPAITNQVIAISTIEIYINVSLYPLCKCCIKKPLFGYLYYLCIQHTWKCYPLILSPPYLSPLILTFTA